MDRVRQFLNRSQSTVWHFWGDSITHGALHTYGQRDYCQLFEERLRYEMGRGDDAVIRMAVSGYATTNLLEKFDIHVTRHRPDVMFLMIGMNDCSIGRQISLEQFNSNLRELARRITAGGCLLVLQTTCPVLPGLAPEREPNFEAYMDVIRNLARELKLPLIDHAAFWMQQTIKRRVGWMDDQFHPNGQGHLAFARYLWEQLGIADPNMTSSRFFLL